MIDLVLYRFRIGTFRKHNRKMKFLRKYEATSESSIKAGQNTLLLMQILLKMCLIAFLLPYPNSSTSELSPQSEKIINSIYMSPSMVATPPFTVQSKKQTSNFKARYMNGNQQLKRGIKNMHLNIRSLGNKVFEIKNIIKEHSPHIFGVSECQLKKVGGHYHVME